MIHSNFLNLHNLEAIWLRKEIISVAPK